MISAIHYVDFHGDATHAICGWTPPADYAGVTVFLSSATCPACIAAIQARLAAVPLPPRAPARHGALYRTLAALPPTEFRPKITWPPLYDLSSL